jgi:hypothetical protein
MKSLILLIWILNSSVAWGCTTPYPWGSDLNPDGDVGEECNVDEPL